VDSTHSADVIAGQYYPKQSDMFEGHRVIYRKNIQARIMNGIVGVIFLFLAGVAIFASQLPLMVKILMGVSVVLIAPAAVSDRFWWLLGFGLIKSRDLVTVRVSRQAIQLSSRGLNSQGFNQQLGWGEYTSAAETEEAFVLFINPRRFLVLPKRAFAPADAISLRGLLRSIFGDKAALSPQ
jgi:hypothetical protein